MMAWKDQYLQQYGTQVGIQPTTPEEPKTWKDRYLQQQNDREAQQKKTAATQEIGNAASARRNDAVSLAQKITDFSSVAGFDYQKRNAQNTYQNPFAAAKRSYNYQSDLRGYAEKVAALRQEIDAGQTDSTPEDRKVIWQAAYGLSQARKLGDELGSEAKFWSQFESEDAYNAYVRKQKMEANARKTQLQEDAKKNSVDWRQLKDPSPKVENQDPSTFTDEEVDQKFNQYQTATPAEPKLCRPHAGDD